MSATEVGVVDKAALLAKRFGVVDVEIEGVGTVQVRPLSRAEALSMQGAELAPAETERKLLAAAMVAPRLTEDEVGTWQANSPAGELEPVADAILTISGMKREAVKSGV